MWYIHDIRLKKTDTEFILNLDKIQSCIVHRYHTTDKRDETIEVNMYDPIGDNWWTLYSGKLSKEKLALKFLKHLSKALNSKKQLIYASKIYKKIKEK